MPPVLTRRRALAAALAAGLPAPLVAAFAQEAARRAPLPWRKVERLSAFDMHDSLGVGFGIGYQLHPDYPNRPWDLPNRNGEKQSIEALRFLGLRHIRNGPIQIDPQENAHRPPPGRNAPSDFENLMTVRRAIPDLKVNYIIHAGNPPHWGDGTIHDLKREILAVAREGMLTSIEAPNEPNFQGTYSPSGRAYASPLTDYAQNVPHANEIFADWGRALRDFKNAEPLLKDVLLLPPSWGVWGRNGPDGVEANIARAKLRDFSALYDAANLHVYGPRGTSMGDPAGPVENGDPPNWGAFQVSLSNWARDSMPGRPVVITEMGANTRYPPAEGPPVSELAQAVCVLGNLVWGKYYGALRMYLYTMTDDSSDLSDARADRWGLFRGDWSAKPSALAVRNLAYAVADPRQSDPRAIPDFAVEGARPQTWGATMALSRSDGSFQILCMNVLPTRDPNDGRDLRPAPERWTLRLREPVEYTVQDLLTGERSAPRRGTEIPVAAPGWPVLVHARPQKPAQARSGQPLPGRR